MMISTAPNNRCGYRALLSLLVGLVALGSLAGCTDQEKKAEEALQKAVNECRSDRPDGAFVEVDVHDDTQEVLQKACEKDFEGFEMTSDVSAEATTGPVTWGGRIDKSSGIWTLYSANFESLDRARNLVEEDDLSENDYERADELFAKAQEQVPESAWIRVHRLDNLLELREKTRDNGEGRPYHIGDRASDYLEETLEWTDENDDPDTAARTQQLVVDYTLDYLDMARDVRDSESSTDEWLEEAAEKAEEDGDDEEAEEYREQIELTDKRRKIKEDLYEKLTDRATAYACEKIDDISLEEVESEEIQGDVTEARNRVECTDVDALAELEEEELEEVEKLEELDEEKEESDVAQKEDEDK